MPLVDLKREEIEVLLTPPNRLTPASLRVSAREKLIAALEREGGGPELEAERNFLLLFIDGFPARLGGTSAEAMVVAALRGHEPTRAPGDTGDLGRCERAYEAAPPSLQRRMLPILEKHRALFPASPKETP
jgi:hypothetical protein